MQIGSVLSDTIVVNEINIQSPEITLEGTLDANNLGTILKNLKAYGGPKSPTTNAPTTADTGKQKKFIVKDIVLTGAKVHVNVSGFGQMLDKSVTIPDIHIQNIGTADNAVTAAELGRQILEPVLTSAVKAAADEFLKNNKDVQKGLQGTQQSRPRPDQPAQVQVISRALPAFLAFSAVSGLLSAPVWQAEPAFFSRGIFNFTFLICNFISA